MNKNYVLVLLSITIFLAGCQEKESITISFTGDVMLSRSVGDKMLIEGYDYPYENVKKLLMNDTITFGNLESPISNNISPVYKDRKIVFRAEPKNALALKNNGYDVLNLGNNHTMDQGSMGLKDTIDFLNEAEIKVLGYVNNGENHLEIIESEGMKIGFLGFTVFPPEGYIYKKDKHDVSFYKDEESLIEVKNAKDICDFLIVSIHWGKEYDSYASTKQVDIGHKLIDSGADIIIGHHPHVLQGIEKYKSKWIFYSLGNFIFDNQSVKGTKQSLILQLQLDAEKNTRWEIYPVVLNNCQPQLGNKIENKRIIELLSECSDNKIGFEIIDGVWVIKQ